MRGPIRSVVLAALAVCAFAALTIGSASAATLERVVTKVAFQAIYGNPGTNGTAVPVGGGLGRNFGFGENMLFEASTTKAIGENLSITLKNTAKTKAESHDAYIGGTVMSNQTGSNNPLSFSIQFVDFQDNLSGGAKTQSYADTSDRPWITEICPPATPACRVEAALPGSPPTVKIENVSFDLAPGLVVQGDAWGEWENGKLKVCPGIKLVLPPAGAGASETLAVTQTPEPVAFPLGTPIEAIAGRVCLISANNDWYHVSATELEEPEIIIHN